MTSSIPAIIIAAGRGSRLDSLHDNKPKTLLPFDEDRRIIDIILGSLRSAGIAEIVMVTGYQGDVLQDAVGDGRDRGMNITYVDNPDWQKPNGLSVLAASGAVGDRQFLLSMSDHLYEPEPVQQLMNYPLEMNSAVVAIDRNLDGVHDIDDAMKLQTRRENSRDLVIAMDKSLREYDSVDCGLFKGTPELFRALEHAMAKGQMSLSNGCEELIASEAMYGCDITGEFWIDVDTPAALEFAQKRWKATPGSR